MKQQQLDSVLKSLAVGSTAQQDGTTLSTDRSLTLYTAHNGVGLTVGQVVEIEQPHEGQLIAHTHKGELYHLALEDVFAIAVDVPKDVERKAGFSTTG